MAGATTFETDDDKREQKTLEQKLIFFLKDQTRDEQYTSEQTVQQGCNLAVFSKRPLWDNWNSSWNEEHCALSPLIPLTFPLCGRFTDISGKVGIQLGMYCING